LLGVDSKVRGMLYVVSLNLIFIIKINYYQSKLLGTVYFIPIAIKVPIMMPVLSMIPIKEPTPSFKFTGAPLTAAVAL